MDDILRDRLSRLDLETLATFDGGKLARQFRRLFGRLLENISDFPVRNGKPESREITIKLVVTPEVASTKKPIENAYGVIEVDVPQIVGLKVTALLKDKLPVYQTGDVEFVVDTHGGRITDARFNPRNSASPSQLEIDFESAPESDGIDSDE